MTLTLRGSIVNVLSQHRIVAGVCSCGKTVVPPQRMRNEHPDRRKDLYDLLVDTHIATVIIERLERQ